MDSKNKKIFSFWGLIIIFFVLILGLFLAWLENSGKIYQYYEKKYPIREFKNYPIKKYRIGFVTDAHSKTTKEGLVRPESANPMLDFVSEMNNNFHPDFVVDGGDFIDGTRRFGAKSMKDYTAFSKIFETIIAPKYKVLGNHELRGMTRENWIKLNKYEKSYYYFDCDKLRVIIFDSTLVPGSENSEKISGYNEQLAWFEDILKNSEGYKKIIFTHYPLVASLRKGGFLEPIEEFNKITSKYGVRAIFSGHVEVPYHEIIGGVDYFVIPGFFKSEATGMLWKGSFSEINIGLEPSLKLFYKREGDKYKTLIIPSEEYENAKKEIMEKVDFLAPTN